MEDTVNSFGWEWVDGLVEAEVRGREEGVTYNFLAKVRSDGRI